MANGNININKSPQNVLNQLIANNVSVIRQEEGEKALRSFFKKSAEEIVAQPGGTEIVASSIQKDLGADKTQQGQGQQAQQPSQPQQAQPQADPNQVNQALTGQFQQPQTEIPPIPSFLGFRQSATTRGQVLKNIQTEQAIRGETPLQQKDIAPTILKAQFDAAKTDEKAGKLNANILFTRFEPLANNFQGIIDSFARVEASVQDPSAAGDLALIFNFMKILDPNSVVRESEFATARNAAGVPDRIRNVYNRVLEGKQVTPNQRRDFRDRAEKLFKAKQRQFQQSRRQFSKLAVENNVDPIKVLRNPSLVSLEQANQANESTFSNLSDSDIDKRIAELEGRQ